VAKIISVKGREILDSRGNPTVEVDVRTALLEELRYPQGLLLESMRCLN
jgi:enolase